MDVEFANASLDRLETDGSYDMHLAAPLVTAYRRRMQALRNAKDERDLYIMKSWHFERLKGKRSDQYSIRLNDQFRLILEMVEGSSGKRLRIVGIEDYH